MCVFCNEICNTKHLIYDCKLVKPIWQSVGNILHFDIMWKHIVLGYFEVNNICMFRNILLTIISKSIHSLWSKYSEHLHEITADKYKAKEVSVLL